ncbi:hypothetical protein NC99_26240 [Sunxiuqinia dokdonensis]|uniref:Uncharacterized protein n=1 Tax=Sunxiuqinia dokdonensis TaxID=1409788 RepID=A0A0L8V7T7_9BACT|nr:hypothetical protein NC99_26240 [Sunxiuqinia dokdonensis]
MRNNPTRISDGIICLSTKFRQDQKAKNSYLTFVSWSLILK